MVDKRQPRRAASAVSQRPVKDRNIVGALSRGIAILTAFTPRDTWLSNSEIARRVRLAKSTVSRITRTLTILGYLGYSPRLRQYRLCVPVLSLGYSLLADIDVRKIARPMMQVFADEHDALTVLGVRDGFDLVLLETCHSSANVVSLRLDGGARLPIADTAFGRALLSALPLAEREPLLAQLEHRYGGKWPKVRQALTQSFEAVRRDGFCLAYGAWQPDINVLAAPLHLTAGEPPLSIGMAGFAGKLTRTRVREDVGARLVTLARKIEARVQEIA